MRAMTTIFGAIILLGGCTEGTITQPQAPDPIPKAGLTLQDKTPEHVSGAYHDLDNKLQLSFDSARNGDDVYLHLTGNDGRHLVTIETQADTYIMTYLGGRLVMTASRDVMLANSDAEDPEAQLAGIEITGEIGTLDELLNAPEMAALPWMSRALGEQGLTGDTYPSSLALHKMAKQTATGLGIDLPPLDTENENAGYCTSYPNRSNDCYGMCGPGCSCWSWVCGNCCYNSGCAKHDSWCRQGKWYYCYNISAVIALFGC